jgi:carotenoid cleavage dioxygenase-like enzyme
MTLAATAPSAPTKGFSTLDSETTVDPLPVTGEIPAWLGGSLLRTGPAKFEAGDAQLRHWFDGLAMLHRFTIAGGQVSYGNRFLRSKAYAAASAGEISYAEFATDPCRSLFKRVSTLFAGPTNLTDNANVNVMKLGERFVAMTETPIAVEFDGETLDSAGVAYDVPGVLTTAHPHADRSTGAAINYAAKLGPRSSHRFFTVAPDSREPKLIASWPVSEPAYMHSFGMTDRWLILAEFPFVVNPLRLALSGRPYIENYRWKPELGTRFTLVDRATGERMGGFSGEACFAFHHVNAYEEAGQVVVDLSAYPDPGIVEDLYLDRLRAGKPITRPALKRFRLGLADRSVRSEQLADGGLELARINYGRCNGRPYRYAWGLDTGQDGWFEQIVKVDVERRERASWSDPGSYPGEPVFVARPGGEGEDDGVLLSVVLDADRGTSYLLVLDAAGLTELARAETPHHIPFGFHGQFARA